MQFNTKLPLAGAIATAAMAFTSLPTQAQLPATNALVVGSIDFLELNDPTDIWSGGRMVVGGQVVIIPRNLLIDLPANRLTLQQLFADAPADARALGLSGLATIDGVGSTGVATILGNRNAFGNVIAGDVFIEKGQETVTGRVTFIDHTDGYLRIDGIAGDPTTGLMVRINDPTSRYTIQQGLGCDGGPNCSPDVRFGVDPDNYTITFTTGYPAGIPSTVPLGQRSGFMIGDNAALASDAAGNGDPFCPATNRALSPVPDSTLFAPIRIGDTISADGNFERIGEARFLSCHTLTVFDALATSNSPTQPDYFIWDEVEWDVPGFANQRVRALFIGFSTLSTSQVDLFALHVDPRTNENNEFIIGSTVGNPDTINQGVGATAGGIFKINYDVDFVAGVDVRRSPCQILANAGFANMCPLGGTLAENFDIISPISREMIGRSRHKATLFPGVITRDINGNEATNGEYLTPVGIGHPEFGEIDLDGLQTPLVFAGIPWNLDRRLSPGGCDGPCPNTPQPLEPFPWSGLDPVAIAPVPTAPLSFFPFGNNNVLNAQVVPPSAFPILPTPQPQAPGTVGQTDPPVAAFASSVSAGQAPLPVSFTDMSTGVVNARLWDFGDGTFSTQANPTHVFETAGTFTVSLTALGLGGTDSVAEVNSIRVTEEPIGGGDLSVDFRANRRQGPAPHTVTFVVRNLLGAATGGSWDFGDGTTAVATTGSITHTYTTPGLYSVTLNATDGVNNDVVTKLDYIRIQ